MMNVNFGQVNSSCISFKSRYPRNYKVAEKIIQEYLPLGLKSATDYEMRIPDSIGKNYARQNQILSVKIPLVEQFINYYRQQIFPYLKFATEEDYYSTLKNLVKKYKMVNCAECAELVHYELKKRGISSRIVSDTNVDHCFVVVNRDDAFVTYKDKKAGEFVADLWLKKIYKSVQEAQIDFNNLFGGVTKYNLLFDTTFAPVDVLYRPLTKREKDVNKEILKNLDDLWKFLQNANKNLHAKDNIESFCAPNVKSLIQKYNDDLADLCSRYIRNQRKNKKNKITC